MPLTPLVSFIVGGIALLALLIVTPFYWRGDGYRSQREKVHYMCSFVIVLAVLVAAIFFIIGLFDHRLIPGIIALGIAVLTSLYLWFFKKFSQGPVMWE